MCTNLRMWKDWQPSHILSQTHIYNSTQQSPNLRPCCASWRWASNTWNTSRIWTLMKCKWKWSVYQVGCVYYVITSLWCTVNKTLNIAEPVLEWEMFWTSWCRESKHTFCIQWFLKISCRLWANAEIYGRQRESAGENTIRPKNESLPAR
jgi:hypothetical protein